MRRGQKRGEFHPFWAKMTKTPGNKIVQIDPCGVCLGKGPKTEFDEAAYFAGSFTPQQVRERWPRGHCPGCNSTSYASFTHFTAGDW
jgi:hypothetical protein